MAAMELLISILRTKITLKLSRNEIQIIELELFTRICDALKEKYKPQHSNYLRIYKFYNEMEKIKMDMCFLPNIINDILSTEAYTLSGIAYYTHTPEDVVYDIVAGINTSPSAIFLRKLIELHRSIRQDLYFEIMKKITEIY